MAEQVYSVNSADLTSIANTIRTKGGTSAALSFPTGFINAINNITVGYKDSIPTYTYSGQSSISTSGTNWVLTCTSSGTLNFSALTCAVDIFIVGGGGSGGIGGGANQYTGGGGGGGGYCQTFRKVPLKKGTNYYLTIGAGGACTDVGGNAGGTSSIRLSSSSGQILMSAQGGKSGGPYVEYATNWSNGGDGGSGGGTGGYAKDCGAGNGGSDGSDGNSLYPTNQRVGQGQGTNMTRAFQESSGTLYAGGGGGGAGVNSSDVASSIGAGGSGGGGAGGTAGDTPATNGTANTGGGGGGGGASGATYGQHGGTGGSGVILIRNAR